MKLSRENLRIVLVDDDKNDTELLQNALHTEGFSRPFTHLRNGGIALEYFKYTKATGATLPHLVLLDLNMPLIDGIHLLQRLRETPSFRNLPVIILTGSDEPARRNELEQLNIFRFLIKLPNFGNVITALDDFIDFHNYESVAENQVQHY